MKRLLVALALLLFALPAYPWGTMMIGGGTPVAGGGPTYIARETFNGAGTDLTWTGSGGTWNVDYTTSPAPLEGAQSAQCLAQGRYTAFANQTDVWVSMMVNASDLVALNYIFSFSQDTTEFAYMAINTDGKLRLYCNNGGASKDGTTVLEAGTTYYIKMRYQKGTGANAQYDFWTSTDGTNWTDESGVTPINNSTDTEELNRFNPYCARSTVIDDIRVDDEDINY